MIYFRDASRVVGVCGGAVSMFLLIRGDLDRCLAALAITAIAIFALRIVFPE